MEIPRGQIDHQKLLEELVAVFHAPKSKAPKSKARRNGKYKRSVVFVLLLLLLGIASAVFFFLASAFAMSGRQPLSKRQPISKKKSIGTELSQGRVRHSSRPTVRGILQFRGNEERNWYGMGPVPFQPEILWRFPDRPMCSESRVGSEVSTWCGTGWTGQPVVWERPDGITEVIVGAYDRKVHFINAETGKETRPPFTTGDIIKGSVTLDPDGDPLLYFGSRDNKLRIVAIDRPRPVELFALPASFVHGIWNNDWDANPTIRDGILYTGGENGYFFAIKLNRDYDERGLVQVHPEMLASVQGWTKELLKKVGDSNASIENSVTLFKNRVYFANSAGRIVGLDISNLKEGHCPMVFDFWAGDDVDATIVADHDGSLYVSVELERFLPRSDEVGQLMKLDPAKPKNPLLWSLAIPPSFADYKGGIWATPALGRGVLYVATNPGQLLAVDTRTGQITFADFINPHAWSSPVVVDDTLMVATCKGEIRAYGLDDPRKPERLWSVHIPSGACIESTPAVWKGRIIVGARDGYIYAFGKPPSPKPIKTSMLHSVQH